jgi:diacylglycerol kinase (ATP)
MTQQRVSGTTFSLESGPPQPQFRKVHIIVNPASGQDRPVLSILNDIFQPTGIDWDVLVTKTAGDARRYAEQALALGVDAVGVYGGDGTVMEVASALAGTRVPLAIFPGGTANVISLELGIPNDPAEACALVSGGRSTMRDIDVGRLGDSIFLTRIGMGLDSNVIAATDRDQKDRMGWVAYALNTLRELADPKISNYTLTLDGQAIEIEGLMCIVANSGIFSANTGGAVLTFAPSISVTDGLLDVMVIRRADVGSLLAVAASIVTGADDTEPMPHWQVREAIIQAEPPQSIQLDGEILGPMTVHASVWPRALRVVVPASAEPPTATRESFEPPPEGTANSPGSTAARQGAGSGSPDAPRGEAGAPLPPPRPPAA